MLKLSHCLASLTLLTIPVIATAASADTYCYMVTASGRKVDLSAMCSKSTQPKPGMLTSNRSQITRSETSNRVFGSTMVQEGRGGKVSNGTAKDYYYQVWANASGSGYRLVVWEEKDFPNGSPMTIARTFKSSGEALDYFDCTYTDKSIAACPNNQSTQNHNFAPRQRSTNTISQ
jgi:hypothetical protein